MNQAARKRVSPAAAPPTPAARVGISLVLGSAADADRRAGRLHTTLATDRPPLRKALWFACRGALVPEDPTAPFTQALATAVA